MGIRIETHLCIMTVIFRKLALVKLSYTESFYQEFESKTWELAVHFGVWRTILVLICNSDYNYISMI